MEAAEEAGALTIDRAAGASQAAQNNAAWCHAVCSARGAMPRFGSAAWVNDTRLSPLYYPNIVTLDPAVDAVALEPEIDALVGSEGFAGFSIKDSFSRLDLSARGFRLLFDATWIVKPASVAAASAHGLRWSLADSATRLAEWEAAWWAHSIGTPCPGEPLFPAALLNDAAASFLIGRDVASNAVVAGCALMKAAGCVGLACCFDASADPTATLREMLAEAHRLHPTQPMVGYDSGAALAGALAAGFELCGPLRVWVHPQLRGATPMSRGSLSSARPAVAQPPPPRR